MVFADVKTKYTMKKIIYSLLLALTAHHISAQSNLIFFTEEGEKFTLFVNGNQINESIQPRVTATGITSDFAQIKVKFDIEGAPELKQNMMIDANMLMTSIIKKNKKDRYVFRSVSSVPIDNPQTVKIVEVRGANTATTSNPNSVATTSTTNNSSDNTTVGINLSAGENGFNLSVNTNKQFVDQTNENNNSNLTNTSSISLNEITARVDGRKIILGDGRVFSFKYVKINGLGVKVEVLNPLGSQAIISYDGEEAFRSEIPFIYDEKDYKKTSVYFKLEVIEPTVRWSVKLKHYNINKIIIDGSEANSAPAQTRTTSTVSNNGCSPMSTDGFNRAASSIRNKSFADEKMTVFKQIARSHCMSVNQIKRFMGLFTYEEGKLGVAKLAYANCTNRENYFELNDALTYSESVDELNNFLENQ